MPWVVGYDEGWSEEDFHFSNGGENKSIHVFCKQLLFKIWIREKRQPHWLKCKMQLLFKCVDVVLLPALLIFLFIHFI